MDILGSNIDLHLFGTSTKLEYFLAHPAYLTLHPHAGPLFHHTPLTFYDNVT